MALAHYILDSRRFTRETQEFHKVRGVGEGKQSREGRAEKELRTCGGNPPRSSEA